MTESDNNLIKAIKENTNAIQENTAELKKINKKFSLSNAMNFFTKKEKNP